MNADNYVYGTPLEVFALGAALMIRWVKSAFIWLHKNRVILVQIYRNYRQGL